jgi:signal transduction histidine kinase
MGLERKLFLSLLAVSLTTSSLVALALYSTFRDELIEQFGQESMARIGLVADTFRQMESLAEGIGENAAIALREIDRTRGPVPEGELSALAKGLKISHIFITDEKGRFIRSTNGPVAAYKNTLFDYCADYRKLIEGDAPLFKTPIIPSSDEIAPGPFKYIMIPNSTRTRVLEVSIHLDFIGKLLAQALETDPNLMILGFYTPSGEPLGAIGRKKEGGSILPLTEPPHASHGPELLSTALKRGRFSVQRKVPVTDPSCCECKTKKITADLGNGYFYEIRSQFSTKRLVTHIGALRKKVALLFALGVLLSLLISRWVSRLAVRRIKRMSSIVRQIHETDRLDVLLNVPGSDELARLGCDIDVMIAQLRTSRERLVAAERTRSLGELSMQVAHDLRSPLAALNTAMSFLRSLPEEQKRLILGATARIGDIAQNLIEHHRRNDKPILVSQSDRPHLLFSLLEQIAAEKRLQLDNHSAVTLSFPFPSSSYGAFVGVPKAECLRVFSNLINNAVEAIDGPGTVSLSLELSGEMVRVKVSDTGRGIPPELIPRLMQKGATFGKKDGSGLGLYHAHSSVEKWGGSLRLESEVGKGTTVFLMLPTVPAPAWFQTEVPLAAKAAVVVIDDSDLIHQIWETRFNALTPEGSPIPIHHFFNSEQAVSWAKENTAVLERTLFLVDYELEGEKTNGIELVKSLGVSERAILVTGQFETEVVLQSLESLNLKGIPKSLAPFTPISL